MKNKHQEENELLEIWKELRRDDFAYLHLFPFEELRYIVPRLIWQLKAKMDDQKKQIIGFAKDNALLHQRLKKCQEENKRLESLRPLTKEEKEDNIQRVINKLKQKGGGR